MVEKGHPTIPEFEMEDRGPFEEQITRWGIEKLRETSDEIEELLAMAFAFLPEERKKDLDSLNAAFDKLSPTFWTEIGMGLEAKEAEHYQLLQKQIVLRTEATTDA